MDLTHEAIRRLIQDEVGRILAALVAALRDFELAEDVLQDALVSALERWPREGLPRNPAAWITTTARNRAIDRLRRAQNFERKQATLHAIEQMRATAENPDMLTDDFPDERLSLIFTCCHPSLAKEAQVALTLQTLGGLTPSEIAAAFLVPLATMQQRLVRAKRKIRDAGVPFEFPTPQQIPERLDGVLSVLYLIFNAGYSAPYGDRLVRADLCGEAIRLARVLCDLMARERRLVEDPEALGLLALMLLHDSRRQARQSESGDLVLLDDQDRALWDHRQIEEGLRVLDHALTLRHSGPYQIQAAIAAIHAEARDSTSTDWTQIALLYGALYRHAPTPVVALNRAVAVAMSEGYMAGLDLIDKLGIGGELDGYHLYHAARADLLRRLGWLPEARAAYRRALDLCQNSAERAFLQKRLDEVGG
ncbi:MAG: RNA polymerase sigma factor [Chloroflexi bacterium]|nr:RNA polymerase sigma factor [Chloroflexota bacterium]